VLRVLLTVSEDGLLRGFEAQGHAGAGRGTNVACAAATVLLRTTGRACTAHGIVKGGGAQAPDGMTMELAAGPDDGGWLRGVTDFLMRGMSDLQRDFPEEIAFRVETTED